MLAAQGARRWKQRVVALIERHWKAIVVLVWLGFCAWFIFQKWDDIRWFGLGDTDDNMRMMQVRGLLHGQGWFDLRQYRLNPPFGANIHWSRLVDLPIAGLILALRPFLGGPAAERWAVAIAPLLPYLLLLFSLALTARRLVDRRAYPLAFLALFFAGSTNGMFMPTRIDHHGWQLALLALSVAGDRRSEARARRADAGHCDGAVAGDRARDDDLSRASPAPRWCCSGSPTRRSASGCAPMRVALGGGTALGFLVFASNDNRRRGLRRLVAGVAVRCAARRRAAVRAGLAVAGGLEAAAGACGRGGLDRSPRSTR